MTGNIVIESKNVKTNFLFGLKQMIKQVKKQIKEADKKEDDEQPDTTDITGESEKSAEQRGKE